MNILVIGGAGYIGSVLVPELLRVGHSVRVLDNLTQCSDSLKDVRQNPRFGFFRGDVSNYVHLRAAIKGAGAVVHLAALRRKECTEDSGRAWDVNCYATKNLADLCAEKDIKLIFASSCSIYGVSDELANEETTPLPISTYARTKLCAERPMLEAGGIVLRFATAYGGSPCMRKDLIVHRFLSDAMRGKIALFDADAYRPLIHVEDIAKGILLSVQTESGGQIFNLGEGNYSKREIAESIIRHLPDVTVEEVERPDVLDYQVLFNEAYNVLNFVPHHSLSGWIEWTCKLIKSNPILMRPKSTL